MNQLEGAEDANDEDLNVEKIKSTVSDGVKNTMDEADVKVNKKKMKEVNDSFTKGEKRVSILIDKNYQPREGSDDEFYIEENEEEQQQAANQNNLGFDTNQ